MLPEFEDSYYDFVEDDERNYEEIRVAPNPVISTEGHGIILMYDCGCSSLFWINVGEDTADFEAYEEAIAQNQCPNCKQDAEPLDNPIAHDSPIAPQLSLFERTRPMKEQPSGESSQRVKVGGLWVNHALLGSQAVRHPSHNSGIGSRLWLPRMPHNRFRGSLHKLSKINCCIRSHTSK